VPGGGGAAVLALTAQVADGRKHPGLGPHRASEPSATIEHTRNYLWGNGFRIDVGVARLGLTWAVSLFRGGHDRSDVAERKSLLI
jgi:hypothetical protein